MLNKAEANAADLMLLEHAGVYDFGFSNLKLETT